MAHRSAGGAKAGVVLIVLATLSACVSSERLGGGQPHQAAAPPTAPPEPPPPLPSPPPPPPPPIDLAGKWKFAAPGGACLMTFGGTPGAAEGTIAPAGGCPGNFFMSRKWTFEHDMLIIRDYKGQVLIELAFADGRFQGKDLDGTAMTLARP